MEKDRSKTACITEGERERERKRGERESERERERERERKRERAAEHIRAAGRPSLHQTQRSQTNVVVIYSMVE